MTEASTREAPAAAGGTPSPRRFTLRQRIVLRIIIAAGYWFIRLVGPTLRVCVSREEGAQQTIDQRPLIVSLWHSCQIPATYVCRDIGVRVMSSNSYDGEYMGRIIRRFGFVAVKGSSSRNAVRALLGLRRALQDGWTVAFTLDGPRGPRRKVKPGPATLARSAGIPLSMFHIAVERAWSSTPGIAFSSRNRFPASWSASANSSQFRRMQVRRTSSATQQNCKPLSIASANSPSRMFKKSARRSFRTTARAKSAGPGLPQNCRIRTPTTPGGECKHLWLLKKSLIARLCWGVA